MSSRLQCAFHSSQAQQLHQPKIAVPERHFHELRTGFDKITAVISNDIKTWAATISPRVVQISPQRMDPWIRYMFLHENHITSTIQMQVNILSYMDPKRDIQLGLDLAGVFSPTWKKNLSYHQFWQVKYTINLSFPWGKWLRFTSMAFMSCEGPSKCCVSSGKNPKPVAHLLVIYIWNICCYLIEDGIEVYPQKESGV